MGKVATSPCSASFSTSAMVSSAVRPVSFATSAAVMAESLCCFIISSIISPWPPSSLTVISDMALSSNRFFFAGLASMTTPPPIVSMGE